MRCKTKLPGVLMTGLVMGLVMGLVTGAAADAAAKTAKQEALDDGARQLTADEIAGRIVGTTVTARRGDKEFLFHYSEDNVLSGRMIDGDWSDTGYYGIADNDRVCLSMSHDEGRLRCVSLLEVDGRLVKFDSAGEKTFELLDIQDGNQL